MIHSIDHSLASLIADRLLRTLGREGAHRAIDEVLGKFSNVELAALAARWDFWARSKQLPPPGDWKSWGFLGGRGTGKTTPVSRHLVAEIEAGRAPLVLLCAQDEQSSIDLQVNGPNGLVTNSPPWFRGEWEASALQIVWPNGARAYVRTPEVPGKIRGLEYSIAWCTEFQSWPVSTREEAYTNVLLSTRLGYSRLLWDATPKRAHPILKERLAFSRSDPGRHVVVRGTTYENILNLGDGYIEELERKFGGTEKGKEELLGEMLDDAAGALVKQAWIERARRGRPPRFARKVVGVDPAVTTRAGSDKTGILLCALGLDSQGYVLKDRTGKYDAPTWATIVLDLYVTEECDLVVVETNKGGNLLTQNLRAAASSRKLVVELVDDKWQPHRKAGTVFVREIYSRGPKEDRAQPMSTAYERGRISHVLGEDLSALEETLTTWEPAPGHRSPDGIDAEVHAFGELFGFRAPLVDKSEGFRGIEEASRQLHTGAGARAGNIAALLGGGGGGGKI